MTRDSMTYAMNKILLAMMVIMNAVSFGTNPKLFFTSADIPALQQKLTEPDIQPVWDSILARADAYSMPSSSSYKDPATYYVNAGSWDAVTREWAVRDAQAYFETIGFVYQMTGDSFYGLHGAALMEALVDVEDQLTVYTTGGKSFDMMRTLATGYDWLSPAMTEAQKAKIQAAAQDYIEWSFSYFESTVWIPYHNYTGVAFGGTGLLALAMEDVFPTLAPGWIDGARGHVIDWYENGFDPEGSYIEGHSYKNYGISNTIAFGDALNINKGINILTHPMLQNLPDALARDRLPGTDIYEGRNDSPYIMRLDVGMLRLAEANNSPLMKYLWNRAAEMMDSDAYNSATEAYRPDYHIGGYSPMRILWDNNIVPQDPQTAGTPLDMYYAYRGLASFRSGWDTSDTLFIVEAGPYHRVTHDQSDQGHFAFYGLGYSWATDLGRSGVSTTCHSIVLVDGVGQAPAGRGSNGVSGEILSYTSDADYGHVRLDAYDAYDQNYPDADPGAQVDTALRDTVYVPAAGGKPAYAVVFDNIQKDASTHEYTWQLVSNSNMDIKLNGANPTILPIQYVTTPTGGSGTGQAAWTIYVPVAGEYRLYGRVRPGLASISSSDSFIVQVDSGSNIDWHFDSSSSRPWLWNRVNSGLSHTEVTYDLTAGLHTIKFKTRELEAQLAAIFLTTDTEATAPFTVQNTNGIYLDAAQAVMTAPMVFVEAEAAMEVVMDAADTLTYGFDYYGSYPRLRAVCDAVNPKFISFMMPHEAAAEVPDVQFSDVTDGRAVTILWSDRYDQMIWTSEGVEVQIDSCAFDITGDINADCVVDFYDFAIFAGEWMNNSDTGDFTGDSYVDPDDLMEMAERWLLNCRGNTSVFAEYHFDETLSGGTQAASNAVSSSWGDATVYGATNTVLPFLNGSFWFYGSNVLSTNGRLSATGDWTISGWARISSGIGTLRSCMYAVYKTGADGCMYLMAADGAVVGSKVRLKIFDSSGTLVDLYSAGNILDNEYHHIAATRQGNTFSLYVDGILEDNATVGGVSLYSGSDRTLCIGNLSVSEKLTAYGAYDEMAVYNHALASDDILNMFLNHAKVSEYHFDEIVSGGAHTVSNTVSSSWGNATAYGTTNTASPFTGEAFDFYGSDVVSTNNLLSATEDWTIAGWAKVPSDISNQRSCMYAVYKTGADGCMYLMAADTAVTDAKVRLKIFDSSGTLVDLYSADNILDGQYHFIAATRKGDTFSLYVDGVLEDSDTVSGVTLYSDTDRTLCIGNLSVSEYLTTYGAFDEMTIYEQALSASQIDAVCDNTRSW